MDGGIFSLGPVWQAVDPSCEERLERGELVHFPKCPFALPEGEERAFLFEQTLSSEVHKNISYDPATGRVTGCRRRSRVHMTRLAGVLADFSFAATRWLAETFPGYAGGWRVDRANYRPQEEATRRLRQTARNDLLHIDAFPSRPTQGYRILRLYVNLNPTEPRVWVTSETFDRLLERYGARVGLPGMTAPGWARRLGQSLLGLFEPARKTRTSYDEFMLRLHDFLKRNDNFQDHAPKRFWTFAPGSAWLLFSDGLSHADLRGRYELDHSYFIAPQTLVRPGEWPALLLENACGMSLLEPAA